MQNVTLALADLFIKSPNYNSYITSNDNIKICVNSTVIKQFK